MGSVKSARSSPRAGLSFVPEVADFVAARSPQTLVLATRGVADGGGLAAALTLRADGVLIGTRLWASSEAAASAATIGPAYRQAWMEGDADNAGVFFGEAAGLIHEVEPAATIIERVVADASRTLKATATSCR